MASDSTLDPEQVAFFEDQVKDKTVATWHPCKMPSGTPGKIKLTVRAGTLYLTIRQPVLRKVRYSDVGGEDRYIEDFNEYTLNTSTRRLHVK